jgi:hypothetical protein
MNRDITALVGIGLFTSLAVALFWILWFVVPGVVQTLSPDDRDYDTYVAFQQSFLIADVWLAVAAMVGAIGIRRHRPYGFLFMLLGGSSAIFLGLMDLSFDLQHGVFSRLTAASVTEFIIVVLLLFLSPVAIRMTWRQFRFIQTGADSHKDACLREGNMLNGRSF